MKVVVALLAFLAMAAPASAQVPDYERFAQARTTSPLFTAAGDPVCGLGVDTRAPGDYYLQTLCRPTLKLTLARPRAMVELFVRTIDGPANLVAVAHTAGSDVTDTLAADTGFKPIVLAAPGGAATITSVDLTAAGQNIGIDDVALSDVPQPDTAIAAAPDAITAATTATFRLGSNVPGTFRCSLDNGAPGGCGPFSGLAVRGHSLTAAAVDVYGAVDATPATFTWRVVVPAPDTAATLVGASAVFSGAPRYECNVDGGAWAACTSPFSPGGGPHRVGVRAVGTEGQVDDTPAFLDLPADQDHDNIPDALEKLPLANREPEVGRQTIASVDSGDVFVKLPGEQSWDRFDGAASLPVGSVVDARKGTVTLKVASNGYAKTDRRHRDATLTLSAGIFEIRQARMRKGATGLVQIPVEIVLKSAPGAEVKCRSGRSLKGVVRTLTATGKGVFRVIGGASRADARNASFTTTDRCDGTVTRVRKGRAKVRAARRTVTVREGHRYFAKARLFVAKKGRSPA
jgi:hypothetical protein